MPSPRKLPPFDELYDLVVNKKVSYGKIATKYGTHKSTVAVRLKYEVLQRGGEWPIKRDMSTRIRRGLREITIDSEFLRESLREAYAQRQRTWVGEDVLIGTDSASKARRDRRYHIKGCGKMPTSVVPAKRSEVVKNGYSPCSICTNLSVRAWVEELGNVTSVGNMARLLSYAPQPDTERIGKPMAVKLLRAIGEEPHPSLLEYHPTTTPKVKKHEAQ